MEAVGIEPTSEKLSSEPSTGLSSPLYLAWSLTGGRVCSGPVSV